MSRGASSLSPILSIRSSMKEKYEWKQKSVTSRTTVQAPAIALTVPSCSDVRDACMVSSINTTVAWPSPNGSQTYYTVKQWVSLSVTPSPTASKVAMRGTKTPYPVPPRRLPMLASTGKRSSGNGSSSPVRIFNCSPILSVLQDQNQWKSSHLVFQVQLGRGGKKSRT